jgi:hypothetical protein
MTERKYFFSSLKSVDPGSWKVHGIGSIKLDVLGVGDIEIESYVDGKRIIGKLNDVLFVPELGANLFSLGSWI